MKSRSLGWRLGAAASLVVIAVLLPSRAIAWEYVEHRDASRAAFQAACSKLAGEIASSSADEEVDRRFHLACGTPGARGASADSPTGGDGGELQPAPYDERATVYGQAVAISGDLLDTPEDFFSAIGGEEILSTTHFLSLAVVNWAHFVPHSMRRWRELHANAVSEAVAAAAVPSGAGQAAAFEHAYYLNAFSDHFLQDSFSTGHMGFNRPASSTSASYLFHGRWNREGRIMRNRRGNIWIGYGDDLLFAPTNATSRRLVGEVSESSIHALLHAFVLRSRVGEDDQNVEDLFPSMGYATHSSGYMFLPGRYHLSAEEVALAEFRARIEQAGTDAERRATGRTQVTLGGQTRTYDDVFLEYDEQVQNRAFKNYGVDVRWIYGGRTFADIGDWQALLVDLNLRAVTDSVRFLFSGGFGYRPDFRPIFGPGFSWQMASSLHGILTHDLALSFWLAPDCIVCFRNPNALGQVTYRLNIESSRFVIGVYLSPAVIRSQGEWTIGWITGLSFETVLTAAGGGPLHR